MNREHFAIDEWYHCYTRGVDKRKTFLSVKDYNRFLELLYLSNSQEPIHRSDFVGEGNQAIFTHKRGAELVSIGAYAIMPNHFHLLIKEEVEGGVTSFMRKLGTAYTMYFNIKNKRTGNLFVKPFRSRHIGDDGYLQQVFAYIHMNPIELIEPEWKSGRVNSIEKVKEFLSKHPYSSFQEYYSERERPERVIVSESSKLFLSEYTMPIDTQLKESREYYEEHQEWQ